MTVVWLICARVHFELRREGALGGMLDGEKLCGVMAIGAFGLLIRS